MTVSSAAVEWQSSGSFERLILVVSTPNGTTVTREFQGPRAQFRLADLAPRLIADGAYVYELRAVPRLSDDVKQRLIAARAKDDDDAIAKIKAEAGIGEAIVQAGAFSVRDGSFVIGGAEAPAPGKAPKVMSTNAAAGAPGKLNPTPNDVVTADDEIIQGSLCVGLDCVNNESFGFDTIRLKENNTRIKFDDTSTTAGCPNNDWQLTANDACGGSNKFSIEDITGAKVPFTITAGAPTNSVFVASSGKVGFGNSSPGLNLHITATDTPAIRQEQTNGGGFTAWTWDIGANEANWFVRDLTSGSRLPFRIRPGAPTSSIDISASGKVGIGTASPTQQLHVLFNDNSQVFALVDNPNTGSSANATIRTSSDAAQFDIKSHAVARTISRFGVTLGGWNELLAVAASNGLAIGTESTDPLILGTNSTNRLQIDGTTGAVTVSGNFTVTGTKNFAMPDPANEKKAIYYTSLEGPEAGTYFRGSAKTVDGEAVIELPGYFSRITEPERMTVQLTPVGDWGQLYVSEKSPGRLVIKVAKGGADLKFDYLVQGVRKGYLDYEVVRDNNLPKN